VETLEAMRDRPVATKAAREADEHRNVFIDWLRSPHDGTRRRHLEEAQHDLKAVTIGTPAAGGLAVPTVIDSEIEARVR
jgi:HK97 family phage major capsid protein